MRFNFPIEKCKTSMHIFINWNHVLMTVAVVVLLILPCGASYKLPSGCSLKVKSPGGFLRERDYIFGAVIQLFSSKKTKDDIPKFNKEPPEFRCQMFELRFYRHYLAVIFAAEEINQNPNILPNVSLGFHIYDACCSERRALLNTLSILTGRRSFVPNYSCTNKGVLIGLIGHMLSPISYVIHELINIYKFPQISYGAQDGIFSNRQKFPTFYRTVASETVQYDYTVSLLKRFNWSWVGIITSVDESSRNACNELRKKITNYGGCVAFFSEISEEYLPSFSKTQTSIEKSSANVIIVYSNPITFMHLMFDLSRLKGFRKNWIILMEVNMFTHVNPNLVNYAFNGSQFILVHEGHIPGLKEYIYRTNPLSVPDDDLTAVLWYKIFNCVRLSELSIDPRLRVCTTNDSLSSFGNEFLNVNSFHHTYSVYIAVYALAHALHNMIDVQSLMENPRNFSLWKFNHYLKKVHFQTSSKDKVYFNEKSETHGHFDMFTWNVFQNGTDTMTKVWDFDSSNMSEEILMKNNNRIMWGTNNDEVPISLCVPACPSGYRKATRKGSPKCCYDCVRCSEGEISNVSDSENCIKCLEDQWANRERDKCIMRFTDFLSFEEPLGIALTVVAVVLSIIAAIILKTFIKHKDCSIVKANNQELSFLVLVSLILSPLCILLFIGSPKKFTCLIRQIAFGIIFTIGVSSILGKTVTVVIAFNAVKPGGRLRTFLGPKIPRCIVLFFSLGQVIISIVWLLYFPPFPDHDTKSHMSAKILKCNEGSPVILCVLLGYIAFLASVCFTVAYLARKLPDIYNEAQHITFSMLVFCCVWISFIPTYLSTKGKYMVAVEIFAILASSTVLLGCVFIPKCYIILFKYNKNTKEKYLLK